MKSRVKFLGRLFSGLQEENFSDLTVERLNAYRAHFNLSLISEELQQTLPDFEPKQEDECHYIEIEEAEYIEDDDNMHEEILEAVDVSIIQEDYGIVEEEVYMDENQLEEEELDISEDHQVEYKPKVSHLKNNNTQQTEDEKLFTFQCHVCQIEVAKMKLLEAHCKQIHGCVPRVKCCSDECDSVLSTWRRLMIHKEKHFPTDNHLKCHECSRIFTTSVRLAEHMDRHRIRFVCAHCGKYFKEIKTLRWHEDTHTKPIEERRNHQCMYEDCGLMFITKQACNNHIAQKHEKVVNYFCTEPGCNKAFFTRKNLYEHVRIHGERKFFCDQCNFKAKTKCALNVHKDMHTVGDSYACDICGSRFSVYRRLKSHMSKSKKLQLRSEKLINFFFQLFIPNVNISAAFVSQHSSE